MSNRRLFAAVCDLDPPGGGAERSLAALLNGISAPGPTLETAPTLVPMSPPEKGLRMYQRLLPKLLERWPEAEVHIAGGSMYPQELAHHPNARVLGPWKKKAQRLIETE